MSPQGTIRHLDLKSSTLLLIPSHQGSREPHPSQASSLILSWIGRGLQGPPDGGVCLSVWAPPPALQILHSAGFTLRQPRTVGRICPPRGDYPTANYATAKPWATCEGGIDRVPLD